VHDASGKAPALQLAGAPLGQPARSDEVYSTLLADGGEQGIPATLFVLLRPDSAGFTTEERYALEAICRHLSLAVRLWCRKRAAKHGAETLAASLNAAALIVDAAAQVVWMNHRANVWAQSRRIAINQGRLTEVAGVSHDLSQAIREAAERRTASGIAVANDLTVEISPVAMPRANRDASGVALAALVILRDHTGCRQAGAVLAENFRLTSAEADLAIALWKGMLIAEYAAKRSVAMSTVRTQLKSLLAKTGSRRQSDVVALVARMQPIAGSSVSAPDGTVVGSTRSRERRGAGHTPNR
jgi:DNA-binding CsgD family transcriptional regulator